MNAIDLKNRVAVITGGSSRLSLAVAERFMASGAAVSLWDFDAKALADAAATFKATDANICPVDIADPKSVKRAMDATVEHFGRIDILVNNIGLAGPDTVTWDYPIDHWQRVINVDLNGAFYCCRALVPIMLRHGYGRIASIAFLPDDGLTLNMSAYSAAQAGVIGLTESLCRELSPYNITANCITPAVLDDYIFKQITAHYSSDATNITRLSHFHQANQIATLVAWICSEECSFSLDASFDLMNSRLSL